MSDSDSEQSWDPFGDQNSQNSGGAKASSEAPPVKSKRNYPYFVVRINENSQIPKSDLKIWLTENFAEVGAQLEQGQNGDQKRHYQIVLKTTPKRTESKMTSIFTTKWPHLAEHLNEEGLADGKEWYCRRMLFKGDRKTRYVMKEETRVNGDDAWHCYKNVPRPVVVHAPTGWQLEVMKLLEKPPDQRKIYWIWESTGKRGKTQLCKWLCVKHGACYLNGQKRHVLATAYKEMKRGCELYLIGVPRSVEGKMAISYNAVEQLKDGLFHSGFGVEATGSVVANEPHVLVFANEEPEVLRFSLDQWCILKIVNEELHEGRCDEYGGIHYD